MSFLRLTILTIFTGLISVNVHACACCAARGTWLHYHFSPTAYQQGELQKLSGRSAVQLYRTEEGDEAIKGLSALDADEFKATISWKNGAALIKVTTGAGDSGTLSFKMPASMQAIKTDLNEVPDSSMNDVTLYLEWNLKAPVTGATGIFRKTMLASAVCTLTFQGRGGMCDEAQNFTHWRIEVSGKKAAYAFFGPVPQ